METSTNPAWWESNRRLSRSPGSQQPGTAPALSLANAFDFEGRTKDDGYDHSVDASRALPTKLHRPSRLRGSRPSIILNTALPEGPEHDGASRSSSGSQVSEANATVGAIEAEEMWVEKSTSDRGHRHRSSRQEVKVDTVQKGDKISTSGSTFFRPGDVLSSGGNSNVVNSSFSAKAGERLDVDDPPSAEEATHEKVRSAGGESGLRDKYSFRSKTSKSTINNPKLLATVEDAIRRLILPELTEVKREQSKKGGLEFRTRSSNGARRVSETGSTPGLTGVRRKPSPRTSRDDSEVLRVKDSNYYTGISPPAQDVLSSRSEVPNVDRVKNMAFSAAGEVIKIPSRRRKDKEREAYKDKESEPSTSMADLVPELTHTASPPGATSRSSLPYPSFGKAHRKEVSDSREDVPTEVKNSPLEQEATEEKEEGRGYRTKSRSKNDRLVEGYEEHIHLDSPRNNFEHFERETSEDTDGDRFSKKRNSDGQSGLEATAAIDVGLRAAALHKDQSEDYIGENKERRRRRTESRRKSKSLAESYEDHEREPVPPMPLMSDINATGISRSSILSAATDKPHSGGQERDGYLAGTPGLNKEDMLSQEEIQGKRLKQENHEPQERYREYAFAAEHGRKYGNGDQDAADPHLKPFKDNKRRTVQVEYVAPRSRTQRGAPSPLSDPEISAVAGAGIPALHHRDDYQRDPELLEDQYDHYHQGPPTPLQYVPPSDGIPVQIVTRRRKSDKHGHRNSRLDSSNKSQTSLLIEYFERSQAERRPYDQETREFWAIPTVSSYEGENQEDQHRKNDRNHGLDSDHSNTIKRLTPTQLVAPKSVQQNASDISSMPADSFLDGRARSPERKQNRDLSQSQREALAAGAAIVLMAGEVADKLETPLRRRSSRSLSRERIVVQRAVEKVRGEKSERRHRHRSSKSSNDRIYEGPVQERRSFRGQDSEPAWETVPRLTGVVKEAERSRENEPPRNEVAHPLHRIYGSHFSVSPSPKNDPSQHEVDGVDIEEATGSLSRAETPRPIEWSINKELPPIPQRTLRRTANNTSTGVADMENGTNMRESQRDDAMAGLTVRDERDRSVALGEGSMGSKIENKEPPIQTQTQDQENDSKLKIKDLRHRVGYRASSSPISPLSATIESNNSSLSLTSDLQAHPKEETPRPSAAKLPLPMDRLGDFFVPLVSPRCFKDSELQQISKLLRLSGRQAWSEIPRIYSVLRMIGHLETIDNFIDHGITDIWFPFSSTTLPQELSSGLQAQFLDVQACVFTKGLELEKDKKKRHAHFGKNDALPFDVGDLLGGGRLSQVHRIVSLISKREYARKRLRRRVGSKDEAEIKSFKVELQILKKIQHIHCVDLVASYTDSKWFCLIMSPVADSDLKAFYNLVANNPARLKILGSFFGCLTSALAYLHNKQIRHRDIKPENILVKGDKVYLTDFGISLDWESLSGSTTTDDSGKTWLYCAPEVAYYQKRNSSSDIWSLGCVFLEMITILVGLKIEYLQSYFREKNGNYRFYTNIDMIPGWVERLKSSSALEDATPLEWAMEMLQSDAAQRPTAAALYQSVGTMERFCGNCCEIEVSSDETGSDSQFWADALENEDNLAPNCPINPPAQDLVTPKDTQVDNPKTEDRLPNPSLKPEVL